VKSHTKSLVLTVLAIAACLLLAAGPARAHHGAANLYDMSKAVVMKGTITKFEWTNPHNQIFFDVTDDKGTVTNWAAATEPPQVMLERGWTRRSLNFGDKVTVYMFVAKNGSPVGNLQKIVLPDGKELTAAGGPPPQAPAPPAGR
jgi:uncharacterized protein DUF6152